jgi:hypothetical protein
MAAATAEWFGICPFQYRAALQQYFKVGATNISSFAIILRSCLDVSDSLDKSPYDSVLDLFRVLGIQYPSNTNYICLSTHFRKKQFNIKLKTVHICL